MSASTFDQFTALQNALSELNYAQPLLRESVPLVQAIFADLIEVTKKYTQIRKQAELKQKELESQLNPIKIENDNLTKSNNTLHLKIIETNDKFEGDLKKMEKQCESFRMAKNELNVLLNQKKHKIKNQEVMINNLKKKMNAIMSRHGANHKKLIGKTAKISFNSNLLSPMQTDSLFEEEKEKETNQFKHNEDGNDKYILLGNENESLLKQIGELHQISNVDKEKIMDLENKLSARKQEITRISENVQIDDNRIHFIKYKQEKENEHEKIKHLESQIDVLQNEIIEKEKLLSQNEVKDAIICKLKTENVSLNDKLEITWSEMDKLKLDLTSIKYTSKALKLEKKYDILKSTKKLSKNVSELTLLQNKIDELNKLNKVLQRKLDEKCKQHSILGGRNKKEMSNIHVLNTRLELKEREIEKLRMEHVNLIKTCDESKNKIKEFGHKYDINNNNKTNLEIQVKSGENKLAILMKENEELQCRYQELKTLNGKNQEMNQELNRENEEYQFTIKCLKKDSESMNERVIKVMQQKNDFEKSENVEKTEKFELVKKLQNIQFKNEDLAKEKEWNNSLMVKYQTKMNKLEKDKKDLNLNINKINKLLDCEKLKFNEIEYKYNSLISENETLNSKVKQSGNMISQLKIVKCDFDLNEKNKQNLEFQLIEFQNENDKLKKENTIISKNNTRKEEIIEKIEKEKHSLKLILQEMHQRINAFQQRLSLVNKERDDIKQAYDNCLVEMDNKNELISNANCKLNDLKSQDNELQNNLKSISKKHNELQQAYKSKENLAKTSMHKIKEFNEINDKLTNTLRQEIKDKQMLKDNIRQISKERDDIHSKYGELHIKYNNLSDEIVPSLNQELILSQAKNGELSVLCNKLDDEYKNAQLKIEQLYIDNKHFNEGLQTEQEKINNLSNKLNESYGDNNNMKCALQKLVNKHDELQNELDKNAEVIQILNNNISEKQSKIGEFELILSETQNKYRMQQKQLVEYDNKLKFNMELTNKLQKHIIPSLKEENKLKCEQLKNFENDINNITKENQFLNNEYAVTINDRDTKNNQLSTALNKILYLESNFKNMDNEKKQILQNYQSVILENEKFAKLSEMLQKNSSDFAMKISMLEQHILSRDHRIKHLEKTLTEANLNNHELQRQNQIIARDLQRINLNNSKNKTISVNLKKDLDCMNQQVVQKQIHQIGKKNKIIVQFKKENEKLQNEINRLNLEKEIASKSLNTAQEKMVKLEDIINNLRVDSISNTEISMQDKDESTKLKLELNSIKDLNQRLNDRLYKLQDN